MIYNLRLRDREHDDFPSTNVWLVVEADSKERAEEKALREYPNREVYEITESYYDAIIK